MPVSEVLGLLRFDNYCLFLVTTSGLLYLQVSYLWVLVMGNAVPVVTTSLGLGYLWVPVHVVC